MLSWDAGGRQQGKANAGVDLMYMQAQGDIQPINAQRIMAA